MQHFLPQEFKAKALRSSTQQGGREAAGIIPAPLAQEKTKGGTGREKGLHKIHGRQIWTFNPLKYG